MKTIDLQFTDQGFYLDQISIVKLNKKNKKEAAFVPMSGRFTDANLIAYEINHSIHKYYLDVSKKNIFSTDSVIKILLNRYNMPDCLVFQNKFSLILE